MLSDGPMGPPAGAFALQHPMECAVCARRRPTTPMAEASWCIHDEWAWPSSGESAGVGCCDSAGSDTDGPLADCEAGGSGGDGGGQSPAQFLSRKMNAMRFSAAGGDMERDPHAQGEWGPPDPIAPCVWSSQMIPGDVGPLGGDGFRRADGTCGCAECARGASGHCVDPAVRQIPALCDLVLSEHAHDREPQARALALLSLARHSIDPERIAGLVCGAGGRAPNARSVLGTHRDPRSQHAIALASHGPCRSPLPPSMPLPQSIPTSVSFPDVPHFALQDFPACLHCRHCLQ